MVLFLLHWYDFERIVWFLETSVCGLIICGWCLGVQAYEGNGMRLQSTSVAMHPVEHGTLLYMLCILGVQAHGGNGDWQSSSISMHPAVHRTLLYLLCFVIIIADCLFYSLGGYWVCCEAWQLKKNSYLYFYFVALLPTLYNS